jgi:hypothetical protein
LIPLEGISEFNVQSNPGVEYGVRGGTGAMALRHCGALKRGNL